MVDREGVVCIAKGFAEMCVKITAFRLNLSYQEAEADEIDWKNFMKSDYTFWEQYETPDEGVFVCHFLCYIYMNE